MACSCSTAADTFYGVAVITALHGEPRLKILRESTEEDWK